MNGRRVYPNDNGELLLREGDYGKGADVSGYNPNPTGYAPVGWTCSFCGRFITGNESHTHGVMTGGYVPSAALTAEARVVDLTARVAVLEKAIWRLVISMPWPKWAYEHDSLIVDQWDKNKPYFSLPHDALVGAHKAYESSSPTPGEAWRAMVDSVEELATAGVELSDERMSYEVVQVTRGAKERAEAALVAARSVMGG